MQTERLAHPLPVRCRRGRNGEHNWCHAPRYVLPSHAQTTCSPLLCDSLWGLMPSSDVRPDVDGGLCPVSLPRPLSGSAAALISQSPPPAVCVPRKLQCNCAAQHSSALFLRQPDDWRAFTASCNLRQRAASLTCSRAAGRMMLRARFHCHMQAPTRCLAPMAAPLQSIRPCFQGQRVQTAPSCQGEPLAAVRPQPRSAWMSAGHMYHKTIAEQRQQVILVASYASEVASFCTPG